MSVMEGGGEERTCAHSFAMRQKESKCPAITAFDGVSFSWREERNAVPAIGDEPQLPAFTLLSFELLFSLSLPGTG